MRTTLDIDDDVLFAAKDFARRDKKTLGQIISAWGRIALQTPEPALAARGKGKKKLTESAADRKFREMGFVTFPNREGVIGVTNELVNRIRDEQGI